MAGKLNQSVSGATYSTVNFYTINYGIDDNMDIECTTSGNPNVLAKDVFANNSYIDNVQHGASGTSCRVYPPALDTDGGNQYEFKLETPGTTTLEVDVSNTAYSTYFDDGSTPATCGPCLSTDSFLLFSKDNKVNMASMLGYYAQVQFKNYSDKPIELFSVGAEVSGSSK